MRADVVGTPALDELAAEADWVGTTVLTSSDPLPSLASLLTGVSPWKHELLATETPHRRPELPTLAEILSDAGYRATARVPRSFRRRGYALVAGFGRVGDPVSDDEAEQVGAALEGAEFLWLHVPDADVVYGCRKLHKKRRRRQAGDLPAEPQLSVRQVLAYADPRTPLPPAQRDALLTLYRRGVTAVDQKLDKLIEGMRRSGRWNDTLLVITASNGTELGEHGQILHGQNLGRESIEVPLLIKLPEDLEHPPAEPTGGRIGQARLWATLVEAVGAEAAPIHEPSLFRTSRAPILSELYLRNGVNRFSLLAEDLQLHWTTRFAPAEPEYYQALGEAAGGRMAVKRMFARLEGHFLEKTPLTARGRDGVFRSATRAGTMPEIQLERWTDDGVERVDDPAQTAALAAELMRRWMRFVEGENSPEGEPGPRSQPVD
ncbi:MAG: sulfatase-like hydrolase/transferase [bacterium]|nr:sulfatase-like hydrolase/transferase [bacterium]